MKRHLISLTGTILIMLAGMATSGCLSMMAPSPHIGNSLNYVRQHKGEGTRRALLGNETELMGQAAKSLEEASFTVIREPHAILGKIAFGDLDDDLQSYAFYFYPSQANGHTDVEALTASRWLKDQQQQEQQKQALPHFFPLAYIHTRLQEDGYDPNVKEGHMFALSRAAFYGYRGTAKKLISKGANVDVSISELEAFASNASAGARLNSQYLDRPANKRAYDISQINYGKANAGVELLTGLKKYAKRNGTERESETRFQEALRTYQAAAVKPQLPETARQLMVQANGAVRDKDYQEATDLYEQTLVLAPWWPEGHFNLALVLAETDDPDRAIVEMKRYLALAPTAPDARAAQDKIYDWQRKAAKLQ
ncbi:MAG: tetratricopeptide repeat protein [Nitrospirae bacterium]|nr:tetratricopeptide repeat protein [Nitrospirota bacterium]